MHQLLFEKRWKLQNNGIRKDTKLVFPSTGYWMTPLTPNMTTMSLLVHVQFSLPLDKHYSSLTAHQTHNDSVEMKFKTFWKTKSVTCTATQKLNHLETTTAPHRLQPVACVSYFNHWYFWRDSKTCKKLMTWPVTRYSNRSRRSLSTNLGFQKSKTLNRWFKKGVKSM